MCWPKLKTVSLSADKPMTVCPPRNTAVLFLSLSFLLASLSALSSKVRISPAAMSTPMVFASGRRNSLFGGNDSASLIAPNLGFDNNFGQDLYNSFPKTARNALPKEAREMMIGSGDPSSSSTPVNLGALTRALGGLSTRGDGTVSFSSPFL